MEKLNFPPDTICSIYLQSWKKRETLHKPENFSQNFTRENHTGVRKAESYRTTKKRSCNSFSNFVYLSICRRGMEQLLETLTLTLKFENFNFKFDNY